MCYMNRIPVFLLAGLCAMVAGCGDWRSAALPPPANEEYLTRCVYTFYNGGHETICGEENETGPSGILVTKRQGTVTNHLILTAGHVVSQIGLWAQQSGKCYLGFRKDVALDCVRRIEAPSDRLRPFLHTEFPVEDIGGFLVHALAEGVAMNGGRVCAVGLDSPFEGGVGILRTPSDYGKYGIGIGTPVFALCSDLSKPLCNNDYDWSCSVIERRGVIRDLHATLPVPSTNVLQNAIIVDFPSVNGNSGGPVFAYGMVDGVRYPCLLGVVSGKVGMKTEWTAVAPISSIVDEIEKRFR